MATNATFQIGDTVQLKSGGPVMTVIDVHEQHHSGKSESYRTGWFAGAKYEHATFPSDALMAPITEKKGK